MKISSKVVALFLIPVAFFLLTSSALAKIGVGVGIGKIVVDDILKPGQIYVLPDLVVINTGDQPSNYGVATAFHEGQPELKPEEAWLSFTPKSFYLEPGEIQQVKIKLDLPLKMEPGDFFAYLEAFPVKAEEEGVTSVGIAAAAKLYFTVEPASMVDAIYYKLQSLWKLYDPWPQRGLVALAVITLLVLAKNYLSIDIGIKNKKQQDE